MPAVMGYESVLAVLRRRGQVPILKGKPTDLLIPLERQDPVMSGDELNQFLSLFGRHSFRKTARRLLAAHGGVVPASVLQGIAGDRAAEYVDFLVAIGVGRRDQDGAAALTRAVDNIGPTLEWYVAELCKRELAGDAEWAVQMEDLPVGGDFDVLGWLAPTLISVELKSGQPSEITEAELRNFLQRDQELAPDLSILLIDTDDATGIQALVQRMNDFVMPLVGAPKSKPTFRAQADFPGLSFGWKRVYITGSQPRIITQLRRTLQHYHAHVKGHSFWGGPSVNFVTGEVAADE
jgi:hypothetical protein